MEEYENVFQKACLIQLSIACWMGSKKLDRSILEELGDSNWLRGRKHLVNPETLNPVKAVAGRARNLLERYALPFPIKGLTLVPRQMIVKINQGLEELRVEYAVAVEEFLLNYGEARREARVYLGDLFDETDYPESIADKFRFEWRLFEGCGS